MVIIHASTLIDGPAGGKGGPGEPEPGRTGVTFPTRTLVLGDNTTFVHRGRQTQCRINIPCSGFLKRLTRIPLPKKSHRFVFADHTHNCDISVVGVATGLDHVYLLLHLVYCFYYTYMLCPFHRVKFLICSMFLVNK